MVTNEHLDEVFEILEEEISRWEEPVVGIVARDGDPFKVLVSTVLSLRTKDATTKNASMRLFDLADTPEKMINLSARQIEEAIYPVGFYKTKTKNILEISRLIIENYAGLVPDEIDELLELPGVGRKTANLVVVLGFGKPGICVDTHVHRITNRWGYVTTKTPLATEMKLREILPPKYWREINDYLVAYGQNLCRPVGPICSSCRISHLCEKNGVKKAR